MALFDTHCHLDLPAFAADREAVLRRTAAAGVHALLIPAIQASGWSALLSLCASSAQSPAFPCCYPALGLHPLFLDQHQVGDLDRLAEWVVRARPLAIGEIGLDFQTPPTDPALQLALFEAQLRIARDAGLPVLLHVRKAHDQVLAALRRVPVPGGIAHAFNGSLQQARAYQELGFRLGFGGMLTFERSHKLRRLAAELPLDALVLETDAPDMTVAAHRGERNSPEYLPEVVATLALLRDLDPAEIAARTTANARALLGLPLSEPDVGADGDDSVAGSGTDGGADGEAPKDDPAGAR